LVWQDFLSWLATYWTDPDFNRKDAIPVLEEKFNSLLASAIATSDKDMALEADINNKSKSLVDTVARIDELDRMLDDKLPPLGFDATAVNKELNELRAVAMALERSLNELEMATEPPLAVMGGTDIFCNGRPFIPVDESPNIPTSIDWKETNYEKFQEKSMALFPPVTHKFPLKSLLHSMDLPANSKLLLPCPLELYSLEDLKQAKVDHTTCDWLNHFADPIEPFKCWLKEEFSRVYSNPGFHFLITRVAHMGPQSRDSKLPALRSMLSSRWEVRVSFETIPP